MTAGSTADRKIKAAEHLLVNDLLEIGPAHLSPQRRDNRFICKHLGKADHVAQVFG